MSELVAFAQNLAFDTKQFVTQALETAITALRESVTARFTQLEEQIARVGEAKSLPGPKGDPGEPGSSGTSVELDQVKAWLSDLIATERLSWQAQHREALAKALSEMTAPKDGKDGRDGKDVDLALLLTLQGEIASMRGELAVYKAWHAETKAHPVQAVFDAERVEQIVHKQFASFRPEPVAPPDEHAIAERVKAMIPIPKDGKDGHDGKDGQSIDPAVVDVMVAGAVQTAFKALPVPTNGKDGASVTADDVLPSLRTEMQAALSKALEAIPKPKDGRDGIDGKDGRDGEPGAVGTPGDPGPQGPMGPPGLQGVPGEKALDGLPGLIGPVGPLGEKGVPGDPGRDGRDGLPGVPGTPGEKGFDGLNGTNGRDGIDGKDGIPWDAADLVIDDERGHVLKAVQGDQVKEWRLAVPWDAKVFVEGKKYLKAAGVTHGGSWWIAQEDTWDKPGQSKAWRLAVKAGRDRDRT